MTKPLIKPELRFKLDIIATKYGIPNRGMTIGQIVVGIMKATNDLTTDERVTLEKICKTFGTNLKDLEKGVKG